MSSSSRADREARPAQDGPGPGDAGQRDQTGETSSSTASLDQGPVRDVPIGRIEPANEEQVPFIKAFEDALSGAVPSDAERDLSVELPEDYISAAREAAFAVTSSAGVEGREDALKQAQGVIGAARQELIRINSPDALVQEFDRSITALGVSGVGNEAFIPETGEINPDFDPDRINSAARRIDGVIASAAPFALLASAPESTLPPEAERQVDDAIAGALNNDGQASIPSANLTLASETNLADRNAVIAENLSSDIV